MEQKAFRLYPQGWTGNSIKELNDLLKDGWLVKFIIPENQETDKNACNVLILERPITKK